MQTKNIGILGVGAALPNTVRTNDWWPSSVTDHWEEKGFDGRSRLEEKLRTATEESERVVLEAMRHEISDPFRGVKERRILESSRMPSDLEAEAARIAFERAGIEPGQVDAVIGHATLPDDLGTTNACAVHQKLGLRESCVTATVDATCNSFLVGLTMANGLIVSGQASKVLLINSCVPSRILDVDNPTSAWFGDGAAATVIGEVPENRGFASFVHKTDSSIRKGVSVSVPGGNWWDEGRILIHNPDRAAAHQMLVRFAHHGRTSLHEALAKAAVPGDQIEFFAGHQAQLWQRSVVQKYAGLSNARSLDIFQWTGNLGGANLPVVLAFAEKEGLVRRGNLVAAYGGGSGVTWSAAVMRW